MALPLAAAASTFAAGKYWPATVVAAVTADAQVVPVWPVLPQSQLKSLAPASVHAPPFWHGLDAQSSMSVPQSVPL